MTDYDPVLVAGPATLPVTLQEVKQHLRLVAGDEIYTDEDGILTIYLNAAVTHLDGESGWLNRAIVAQTWSQQFDRFERALLLGLSPISSITSVAYLDAVGVSQAVAADQYALINQVSAPELRFIDDYDCPIVQADEPVLTVTFVGGFGDAAEVPAAIKAAILLMVGDMYRFRSAKIENAMIENRTVRMLLDPYRRGWVA